MTPSARFVEGLLKCLANMAVALAALALIVWGLGGCAFANEGYWSKTHSPQVITDTQFVDYPCGKRADGCFNRIIGVIQLRKGMNALHLECVWKHEKKHAAGYSHPANDNRPHYSIDCGDGSTYVAMRY